MLKLGVYVKAGPDVHVKVSVRLLEKRRQKGRQPTLPRAVQSLSVAGQVCTGPRFR